MSLRSPGAILLVSCYELGHQPLGVALPLGFLDSRNGHAIDVDGVSRRGRMAAPYLHRLPFVLPARTALPALDRYARLEHRGERQVTGYAAASRGCLHLCTHCPIPPVYGGRFFVIPEAIVLGPQTAFWRTVPVRPAAPAGYHCKYKETTQRREGTRNRAVTLP